MQANPDKFQVLAVGKKTFEKNMKICIQNSTLSCEIFIGTKMPSQRAEVKVTENESVEYS
jgi:hypothetical protein